MSVHCLQNPGGPSHGVRLDRGAGPGAPRGRTRTGSAPRPASSSLLDLASNDYLGLARHPEVVEGAASAARTWGGGATGSRLVTGTTALHAELESELAGFCGFEAALVFSSGYAANLAAVTALAPHGSLVVSDAGNHASLIDGCRLARGTTQVVGHADPDAVRKALATHDGPAVAVSDTVFSVDGDAAPLAALADACRAYGAGLIVDDAHGLGVLGDGGRGARRARASRAATTSSRPSRCPSRSAPRAAPCWAPPGSSPTWSTRPARSSSTRDSPPPPPGRPRGAQAARPRAGACGAGPCRRRRTARTPDHRGAGRGTSGRRGRLGARTLRGGGRAVGGRLPSGRPVRGLLPPSFRARRHLTAQADRSRGPLPGTDRARCTGDRRNAAMSRRDTAVRRPVSGAVSRGRGGR